MRRLAKQDREDKYASRRDYQTITKAASTRIVIDHASPFLVAEALLESDDPSDVSGFGCFLRPNIPTKLEVLIDTTGGQTQLSRALNGNWSRLGVAFLTPDDGEVRVTLSFTPRPDHVDIWGLSLSQIDAESFVDQDQDALANLPIARRCRRREKSAPMKDGVQHRLVELFKESLFCHSCRNKGANLNGPK